MGKLWLNNELIDRLAMLQQTETGHKSVNYDLHNPATINFIIPEQAIEAWKADYADMRRFFIYGPSLEFDELKQRIEELQERVRKITYLY